MTRTHTRIISIVVAVAIVAAMLTAYRAGGWRMLLARDRAVRLFRARKFADADSAFQPRRHLRLAVTERLRSRREAARV
jgi:hypothetical protein